MICFSIGITVCANYTSYIEMVFFHLLYLIKSFATFNCHISLYYTTVIQASCVASCGTRFNQPFIKSNMNMNVFFTRFGGS